MKQLKKWILSIAVCFLLGGCRNRSMPNNRVIRQSKSVEDVMQEQTAQQTPETVIETAVPEEVSSPGWAVLLAEHPVRQSNVINRITAFFIKDLPNDRQMNSYY